MLFSALATMIMEKYPDTKAEFPLDCEINTVELYAPSEISPPVDSLCIFTAKQLTSDMPLPLCFACVGIMDQQVYNKILYSNSNYILIPETASADAIFYILSLFGNTLKQQKLYSDLSYMLLSGADISSVFCEFSKGTGCQMLAIDASGKVLSYSKPFMVDHPHWKHSIEVGYLDNYLIEYILSYRVKHNLEPTKDPFVVYCDRLKMYIKVIRIIANNERIGYIFMGNYTGEFPWFSDKFMHLLARTLHTTLLGHRSYSTYQFNMRQNVLADIIDGASEEESTQRINAANLSFPTNMRTIVIKPSYFRGNEYLYDVLMPVLTSILPDSPKILKKGTVVSVLKVQASGEIPAEIFATLTSLANDHSLRIGISNMFHKATQMAIYYQQARDTLSFSKRLMNTCGTFFFSDYAFYIMLDSVEDKSMLEHCRQQVLVDLEQYDAEKNTELYETLKIYAQTGFSKNRTAELMFMHRNTVNYRIQQIENLFPIDFSDPTLLFKLQYSFHIDAYLKNRFTGLTVASKESK